MRRKALLLDLWLVGWAWSVSHAWILPSGRHPWTPLPRRRCSALALGASTEKETAVTTLEYSPNFRRHIVRKKESETNAHVVQSFAWFDQAVQAFPHAQRIPRPVSLHGDLLPLAGSGTRATQQQAYPIHLPGKDSRLDNEQNGREEEDGPRKRQEQHRAILQTYLQSTLGWYESQVDALLVACPFLLHWPTAVTQERIDFLRAPLPPDDSAVLEHVKAGTAIDWPVQFYRHGRGAGVSVAQLSHLLQVLPQLLFRDLQIHQTHCHYYDDRNDAAAPSSSVSSSQQQYPHNHHQPTVDSEKLRQARFLYQETPAVVLELTCKQLDGLYGASHSDAAAYSYLHWKGWDFDQIRIVLQALPGTVQCDLQASWELFDRCGATAVRPTLRPEALSYLRYRLQISPSHIQAMLKTHAALSYYRPEMLERHCDALQDLLDLSSNALRSLVLRMPSVLGMAVPAVQARVHFWTDTVGLSTRALSEALTTHPALLQYSVENNLEPKWTFFRQSLGLSPQNIQSMTVSLPHLWGRSLERHWQPLCTSFGRHCGNLTLPELGAILSRAPELAASNWKRTLQVKLDFLADRLDLTPADLGVIVSQTPRVLMKSIRSYLGPNIDLLEEASSRAQARQAVLQNPSLLMTSPSTLAKRLRRAERSVALTSSSSLATTKGSLSGGLLATKQSRRRSTRVVHLVRPDDMGQDETAALLIAEQTFASVADAAAHAQVSRAKMYSVLRQGRLIGGRRYVLADPDDPSFLLPAMTTRPTIVIPSPRSLPRPQGDDSKLIIYTAGRAFPPENVLRGRRRAGGMAIQVPRWTKDDWKRLIPQLWKGQPYRLLRDDRILLLGYSYTRPSRTRCSLYACKEALRAAELWVRLYAEEKKNCTDAMPMDIEIVTDSNRCAEILDDASLWDAQLGGEVGGNHNVTVAEDASSLAPPLHQVNPDILQPLHLLYTKLVEAPPTIAAAANNKTRRVRFRKETNDRLGEGALLAAKIMYDSRK